MTEIRFEQSEYSVKQMHKKIKTPKPNNRENLARIKRKKDIATLAKLIKIERKKSILNSPYYEFTTEKKNSKRYDMHYKKVKNKGYNMEELFTEVKMKLIDEYKKHQQNDSNHNNPDCRPAQHKRR